MTEPLLQVDDLTIGYPAADGVVQAVRGASFTVGPGERIGIVGESGSGKSTLALALMRLLPPWAQQLSGTVRLLGEPLESIDRDRLRHLRGGAAAMVFQDPNTSFDPLRTIGDHLAEGRRAHGGRGRDALRSRAVQVLRAVGMPTPESQLRRYPHELSGGMRQRSLIALGLQNDPRLLIADEPTTALDVTIQAQILALLKTLVVEHGTALIMITHDLGVVAGLCDVVNVLYAGRVVERAGRHEIFADPRHPYTYGLLGSIPRLDAEHADRLTPIPGSVADNISWAGGCAFAPRCANEIDACRRGTPELAGSGHLLRCFNPVAPELAARVGAAR
jgi:peptide/nickel transport system ATP-binding protein